MPYKDRGKRSSYQQAWMQRRRDAWLRENGPCAFCGSWEDLQVDHIDAEQKVTHRLWSLNAERRAAELAKCRVVCGPCHRERHAKERRRAIVHGTRSGYAYRGCRCAECRAAQAEYQRQRRKIAGAGLEPATLRL